MARDAVLGLLETERLALRPQQVGDAAVFRRLWEERDPHVPWHRRLVDDRPTVEDIAAHIADGDATTRTRLLTVVRRDDATVLGYCGLNGHGSGTSDEPELAFELLREVHGRGYATEAGRVVVGWARGAGYGRLWAGAWSWNAASLRVLHKLGFREVRRTGPTSPHGVTVLTALELRCGDVPRPDGVFGSRG